MYIMLLLDSTLKYSPPEDDDQVKQILYGNPTYEIQSHIKIVRIFTSSTFTGQCQYTTVYASVFLHS